MKGLHDISKSITQNSGRKCWPDREFAEMFKSNDGVKKQAVCEWEIPNDSFWNYFTFIKSRNANAWLQLMFPSIWLVQNCLSASGHETNIVS